MKSNLINKLLSICGSSDKTYGYSDCESITKLTEEQRIKVEVELTKHFEFDKIIWMELPSGPAEDKITTITVDSLRISDSDNPIHKHKVGYVYSLSFTPTMYEPGELHKPVKNGCVFAPTTYNPETFEPLQSITLTWSPAFRQDLSAPKRTYEDDKQMIRDLLEKLLDNPEEYKPAGHIRGSIRYIAV